MVKTAEKVRGAGSSLAGRARGAITHYLAAQLEHAAGKAAEKLSEKVSGATEKLTQVAENGGQLPAIGSRILHGESPLKAFLSEKAKSVKDNVVGRVKGIFGGGGGGGKAGDTKVTNIVEFVDVGVPVRTAYDHWTQYEKFSAFTKGVRSVSKSDDVTSDWRVKVGPSTRSFKATIREQIPDDRIVWNSEGAKGSTHGAVSFHELAPNLTRIALVVEYYPSGFFEKTGNIWRAQGRRLRLDVKHFQRHVTLTDEEPEGWRGEIRDGEVLRTHEEAMEEEEAAEDDTELDEADEADDEEEGAEAESEYDDSEYDDEEEDEEEEEQAADEPVRR
ncbi:SRPBCC family protein [Streptomyces sp. NPDC088341]|uniref:SRPBCC family protein n=1 Tax=Streptomyces sp. NPDC088341 TaxID=3154870 RepID=UPI00344A00E6